MSGLSERFFDFVRTERFPHALLFTGGDKAARREAALYAASLLVCREGAAGGKPCGRCGACLKASRNMHPDILDVSAHMPDGKYKTENLRSVIAGTYTRPNDGEAKVYIFYDCGDMSALCQNTLLKATEEPGIYNRFIFTAQARGEILPTLASRLAEIPVKAEEDGLRIGNGAETAEEAVKIVRSVIKGFAERSEYGVAAAFGAVKTRQVLGETLTILSGAVREALLYKSRCAGIADNISSDIKAAADGTLPENLISMEKEILIRISEQEYNPNIALAASAYSSVLWRIYEGKTRENEII